MQQKSLASQNVKILNVDLFNQTCPQLENATAEPRSPKNVKFLNLELFNQICPQQVYATAESRSPKCQNSKFCNSRALVEKSQNSKF